MSFIPEEQKRKARAASETGSFNFGADALAAADGVTNDGDVLRDQIRQELLEIRRTNPRALEGNFSIEQRVEAEFQRRSTDPERLKIRDEISQKLADDPGQFGNNLSLDQLVEQELTTRTQESAAATAEAKKKKRKDLKTSKTIGRERIGGAVRGASRTRTTGSDAIASI